MKPDDLGISITTRNRWRDVERTLSRITSRPDLEGCPVVVVDDGSRQPVPKELAQRHPSVRFIASGRSLGASAQRTRIAGLLSTEFVLQLDDDSYPVEGTFAEAVSFLRGHADAAALALNIVMGGAGGPWVDQTVAPYAVHEFIGCGFLYRRALFLELGGFPEALGYYLEENHFSARAVRDGRAIYMFPSIVIRHEKSPTFRSLAKIAYYKGRNRVLLVLWHYPLAVVPIKLVTSLPGTLALVRPIDYPAAAAGFLAGLFDGLRTLGQRRPLSIPQYHTWRQLPSCYDPRKA